jgi:uncharacterized protein (DUF427 family)
MVTREREAVGPGEESVWDYPRPPRVEPTQKRIEVYFNGEKIADTTRAYRVLETSHPPVYYIPPEDVRMDLLTPTSRSTYCEFKGSAGYYTLSLGGRTVPNAAWLYPDPTPGFREIAGYVGFYPGKMDRCLVDGEEVQAQPGDFYGGWITKEIKGPFKGTPGTMYW